MSIQQSSNSGYRFQSESIQQSSNSVCEFQPLFSSVRRVQPESGSNFKYQNTNQKIFLINIFIQYLKFNLFKTLKWCQKWDLNSHESGIIVVLLINNQLIYISRYAYQFDIINRINFNNKCYIINIFHIIYKLLIINLENLPINIKLNRIQHSPPSNHSGIKKKFLKSKPIYDHTKFL